MCAVERVRLGVGGGIVEEKGGGAEGVRRGE